MVVGKSLLEFFEMACLTRWIWIKLKKHEYLSVQKYIRYGVKMKNDEDWLICTFYFEMSFQMIIS